MAQSGPNANVNLGFLTILDQDDCFLGGYLVTNLWGRPLEFRLSSPVQPSRIQQILYGGTLKPFLCAELIGKTLVDKTATAAQCIFTDCETALDLRLHSDVPVVWLAPIQDPVAEDLAEEGACVPLPGEKTQVLIHHPQFPGDRMVIQEIIDRVDSAVQWSEPFARIREALAEAGRMGVAARA